MRHFSLMRIGLLPLLAVLAMPLHAEVFPGEKAGSPVQNTMVSYAEQHATSDGTPDRAAFRNKRTAGTACEEGKAKATLSLTEAGTASLANSVDTPSHLWEGADFRLKSRTEAIRPLPLLTERLSLYPAKALPSVVVPLNAYPHGIPILQSFARQTESRSDALQRHYAALDANPKLAKAAQKATDMLDHDIASAHKACAAAKAEANTASRYAAAAATRSSNSPVALGAEQREEAKLREKLRNPPKRKPVEQAEAAPAREAASVPPAGLCAIATGAVFHARLRPPVHGVIVKDWGEATDAGPATGVSYQVVSGARVVSPCGGRVVFAGSFRSFRQLLIVDCGGGYHIVLSGLEKLDVRIGQTIGTGEPVGVMPSKPGSTSHRQVLYIELRRNGHPVNPALWLRNNS